jgi:SAM-dependent methyltransferase
LNVFPYPWGDDSVDGILMFHTLEHLDDWWGAFTECARILKVGAQLEIRVPDESSLTALTYRDHKHVFSNYSFHGIQDRRGFSTNAWAHLEDEIVPFEMVDYKRVPHNKYMWMTRWPFVYLLGFCADHLRNFIHEQRFLFTKVGDKK